MRGVSDAELDLQLLQIDTKAENCGSIILAQSAIEDQGPETWVEEHGDLLFRFAISRVRNEDTAAELVQDTLLSGIKAWQNFKGDSAVSTWLVSILKNKIIDHMRKASSKYEVLVDEPVVEADTNFNRLGIWNRFLSDWGRRPDKALEGAEFIKVFKSCLSHLPEKYSNPFTLRVLEDTSTEEICKILSITSSNLGALIYRARMKLRDCIEKNWERA
ncbi:sigma-70 family RNA polymerase sigma factor [Oligoflexia bacterium]|nr:sigma-70 family RNA polymerase sigma factor [Oligoflexia bacterium]